jgi:hypothetical protein
MLGSITPLGERGRGMRWGITATAFVAGSAIGGALVGGLLGLAGGPVAAPLGSTAALALLAVAAGVGLLLDVGPVRLPSVRRQVDERWLRTYRGWVYGGGFGLQLGAGMTTIVTTSAVYLTFAAAALSGGVRGGLVVGLAFGLARAWTLAPASAVRSPGALLRADAFLRRWEAPARRVSLAALGGVALAALAMAAA